MASNSPFTFTGLRWEKQLELLTKIMQVWEYKV